MNVTRSTSRLLPLSPPQWAEKFGEDEHGVFACFFVQGVEFELRWIPPGSFMMGSPDEELGRSSDEGPQHAREVAGFWMGRTPVTQAQWMTLRDGNPSRFDKGGTFPVEQVSWRDVVAFAKELDEQTGVPLRLPQEVEWEYACRAGSESALYHGKDLTTESGRCPNLDEIAWYDENSNRSTKEIGEKLPNAWGLEDMLGNVFEWCADVWDDEAYAKFQRGDALPEGVPEALRVVRGGSWLSLAWFCRAAFRFRFGPVFRRDYLGFRLAAGQEPGAAEPP